MGRVCVVAVRTGVLLGLMTVTFSITGRKFVMIGGTIIVVSGVVFGAFLLGKQSHAPAVIPTETTEVMAATMEIREFKPYYFENETLPANLQLVPSSTSYSNGLLFFTLSTAAGQKITITQQKLPDELASSTLQGDENFNTINGKATVSSTVDGRMTGSLVTDDGVLIILNSNDVIDPSLFKNILSSFRTLQ